MNQEKIDEYREFARQKLGFEFNDIQLLITALTHRSYMNEHKKTVKEHNERLEFLGDAVLEMATSDFLYRNYMQAEGIMTSWRAALVRTESIAAAGERLGYESLIRLSKGERQGLERAHQVIMADCFEAVVGAVYLDQGYRAAEKVIYDNILVMMDEIIENESWRDAKSHLQELAQRNEGVTPVYRVLKEEGPDHDKRFTVGVYVMNKLKGTGSGSSKQTAQVEAAAEALKTYEKEVATER
jgi:ribonuclease-3